MLVGKLFPHPYKSDSLFVTRDHDFGAFWDCGPVLAAHTANAPRSSLQIHHLPSATFADRDDHVSHYSDHFEVARIERLLVLHQQAHEAINKPRAGQTC